MFGYATQSAEACAKHIRNWICRAANLAILCYSEGKRERERESSMSVGDILAVYIKKEEQKTVLL